MTPSKGEVRLRYIHPDNPDQAVVDAARIDKVSENPTVNLISYMLRHGHTSPFEQVRVSFFISAPLFVVHQWLRHRMASVQEESLRYTNLDDIHIYAPEEWRLQSEENHQGSSDKCLTGDDHELYTREYLALMDHCERFYKLGRELNVAKELCRIGLPLSLYKEFIWTTDLHNLLHFLKLRYDSHAQQEIREYAEAMYKMVKEVAPITINAWDNYVRQAITLSKEEQRLLGKGIQNLINGHYRFEIGNLNKREYVEFTTKLDTMRHSNVLS